MRASSPGRSGRMTACASRRLRSARLDAAAVALDDRACTIHRPEPHAARLRLLAARRAHEARRTATGAGSRRADPAPRPPPRAATVSPPTSPPTRIVEPAGANLLALASRLTNTWVSRGASPRTARQRIRQLDLEPSGRAGRGAARVSSTASSTTSSSATRPAADRVWPASMRTLSSRLSISWVSRRLPRSSERTSSRLLVAAAGLEQAGRAAARSRRAGRRAACGTRARCWPARRRAGGAPASTLGLVAQHLQLLAPRSARRAGDDRPRAARRPASSRCSVARAPPRKRAWTIGQLLLARAHAVRAARVEHVAAEAADRLLRVHAEQRRRLRIEVADAAVAVDAEHPFDDAGEDRLAPRPARRRSSEVSWSSRRRISSMVAARVPSSAPGAPAGWASRGRRGRCAPPRR